MSGISSATGSVSQEPNLKSQLYKRPVLDPGLSQTQEQPASNESQLPNAEISAATTRKKSSKFLVLIGCVAGIYSSFLSWSYFHENISVARYGPSGEQFKAPLFIQIVQNIFAFIIGLSYLGYKYAIGEVQNRALATATTTKNDPNQQQRKSYITYLYEFFYDPQLLKTLIIVSVTQSVSTPIGNSSLNHIDFVTYLLAKSCKLIPVLIIHTFLYKRKFPAHKYLIAVIITAGVFLFSYKKPSTLSTESNIDAVAPSKSATLGMSYLLISLLLDGLTNSTQDQMFKKFKKMTGIHLMISLNFISFFLVLIYSTILTNQLTYSLKFIHQFPDVLYTKIIWYAICGSVGQIFIFLTLEQFDSMILITINVTRKMFSMILSLLIFQHPLNRTKLAGIALVFCGIGLESYLKLAQRKVKTN